MQMFEGQTRLICPNHIPEIIYRQIMWGSTGRVLGGRVGVGFDYELNMYMY